MYFFLCFLGLLCVCSTEGCPDNCICEEYQSVCQIQQCSDDLPFEYTDFLKIKGVLCQRHKDFLKSLSPNTIIVVTDDSCAGLHNCRDEREDVPTEVIPEHNFVPVDEPEPLPEIVPPIEVPEPLPEMQPEPEPLPEIMPEPEQPERPYQKLCQHQNQKNLSKQKQNPSKQNLSKQNLNSQNQKKN